MLVWEILLFSDYGGGYIELNHTLKHIHTHNMIVHKLIRIVKVIYTVNTKSWWGCGTIGIPVYY